jgi:4-amino-4-deoxychorismate lyase
MSQLTLVDGRPVDVVSIWDRGLAYGDGIFDTLLVEKGRPQLFQRHLERLLDGCVRLSIDVDARLLQNDMLQLAGQASTEFSVLKTVVTRGDAERGYRISESSSPRRILSLSPFSDQYPGSLSLRVCDTRLSRNAELAGLKHLSKLENVLARKEWRTAVPEEGLMLDQAGLVIEGTMSNVFWVKNKTLFTPALTRCGVSGVIRDMIIEQLAPQLGLPVRQGDFNLSAIYAAEELLVSNSVMGIKAVHALGCHQKNARQVTTQLQQALRNFVDA